VVSGQTADHDAENKADGNAEKADSQRYPGAVEQAREDVTTKPITSHQEKLTALGGADHVEAALEQAPEFVFVARAEEAELLDLAGVVGVVALQGVHVERHVAAVDEETDEIAVMEEPHPLRWRVDEIHIAGMQIVRRQDLDDGDDEIERKQKDRRDHR
jgi:hypothetical protein